MRLISMVICVVFGFSLVTSAFADSENQCFDVSVTKALMFDGPMLIDVVEPCGVSQTSNAYYDTRYVLERPGKSVLIKVKSGGRLEIGSRSEAYSSQSIHQDTQIVCMVFLGSLDCE